MTMRLLVSYTLVAISREATVAIELNPWQSECHCPSSRIVEE